MPLADSGHGQSLKQHAKTAVIALDAATTGRLSHHFLPRTGQKTNILKKSPTGTSSCKWHQKFWDKVAEKYIPYIGAPSMDKIIEAVHGKTRGTQG
jgi:hypothetical protein